MVYYPIRSQTHTYTSVYDPVATTARKGGTGRSLQIVIRISFIPADQMQSNDPAETKFTKTSAQRLVTGETPRRAGFTMPPEFGPHEQSWMLWPERTDVWPFGAKRAREAYCRLAIEVSRFEPVTVGVSTVNYTDAREVLPSNIRVVEMSYNGCWIRDTGPTFVRESNGLVRGVHWGFNAWGGPLDGLYSPWDLDASLPERLCDLEDMRRWIAPMVLEGGAIHVDGDGTLLAVKDCVINPNRNPSLSLPEIEALLGDYLGISNIIWIPRGLRDDETGGHVDNICFFADVGKVILSWTDNPQHPQYDRVHEAFEVLNASVSTNGKCLEVIRIPLPSPQSVTEEESQSIDHLPGSLGRPVGMALPASYANCYFVNGGVIVPTFNDPMDEVALQVFRREFPSREIVPFFSRNILIGGGNVHCSILQQPLGYGEFSKTHQAS